MSLHTAVHEAGHAVVARHYGYKVERICIQPEGDRFGHCIHNAPSDFVDPAKEGGQLTTRERSIIFQFGVIAVAGQVAAENEGFFASGCENDHAMAGAMASWLDKGLFAVDTKKRHMNRMYRHAREITLVNSSLISHVASSLLRTPDLSGSEFQDICSRFERR